MEYKVGDKVRLFQNSFDLGYGNNIVGGIFTINKVYPIGQYSHGQAYSTKEDASGLVVYGEDLELIKDYKLKKPTHLVVWNEDRDPCRFFSSEQEAKDFIKELSEKSEVKKESIILVEIKSCKKVSIMKSLRYSEHKV